MCWSFAILVAALCILVPNSEAAHNSEIDAKLFAQSASERLFKFYDEFVEHFYLKMDKDPDDIIEVLQKVKTIMRIIQEVANVSKDAKMFDTKNFKDKELKTIIEKIKTEASLFILEDEFFTMIFENLDTVTDMALSKNIKPYNKTNTEDDEEKIAYNPDVKSIIIETEDADELKYYWKEWHDKYTELASLQFPQLLQVLNKAAELLDENVLDFWYQYYGGGKFLNEMEEVMEQLRPYYEQLHAYIRHKLSSKYGSSIIQENGLIPDHLYQQVLMQVWENISIVDAPYQDAKIPDYDNFLINNKIDAKKLYDIADDFYESLGFEPMPKEFWDNKTKEKTDEETNSIECESDTIDFSPNVYLRYCQRVDFMKFLQAHHDMGRIHFAIEKRQLPAYYFDSYELENPVGEAIMLSASTVKHLKTIGLTSNFNFTEDIVLNRLSQMGVEKMLTIPMQFIQNKIMHSLLDRSVDVENVNTYYWQLMREYVGVEPPMERSNSVIDFAFNFGDDLDENQQVTKFVAHIQGFQFYDALCEKAGHGKNSSLHDCDFYGSKNAGEAIKEMMKLGSSKSRNEVLSVILKDDTKLSAGSLLKYYAPLWKWIEHKNMENNVKIGWSRN